MEGRVTDNELGANNNGVGGAGRGKAGKVVEEAAGGLFADFFAGIINRCQFWLDDAGDGIVIKANDGDIFRDAETAFLKRLEEHGSEKIIGNKGSVGAGLHCEDLAGGADGG